MSNEATIVTSLSITSGALRYTGANSFQADVAGRKGPTPGAFTAAITGTLADLSNLSTPGLAVLRNLDDTNFVSYGIYDPEDDKFHKLGEILPGESFVVRLSRNLGSSYDTEGTGTIEADTGGLMFVADTDPVDVSVEAFEA